MTTPMFTQSDFERVLAEQERLIALANDLEYSLHVLNGSQDAANVLALQQVAGTLVGALREHLFRQDQIVLPVLESLRTPEPVSLSMPPSSV